MEDDKKRKALIITSIICTLTLIGFLGSYAYFINTPKTKNQEISVETGNLSLVFEDGNAGINEALNFGSSITKTFTIENNGSLDATAVMYFDNLINSYTFGSLTYTLFYSETEDGEYTPIIENKNIPRSEESTSRILANNLSIPSKQKYYYKLTITLNYLSDIDQTADLNAIFTSNFKLEETGNRALDTLKALGLKSKEGTPDFAVAATTDETADGLYSMEDDYGTSYYFRGASENNYVKFAGFYWRIVRINGDGSVRIIYDGTKAYLNGENNADRSAIQNINFSDIDSDAKYVGYMYGPAGTAASTSKEEAQSNIENSTIKTNVDNWYKTNILDKGYETYIGDEIFCNDRTIPGKDKTEWSPDTALGYGKNVTGYGAAARFGDDVVHPVSQNNPMPIFTCSNKNDAFTKNDTKYGNESLIYPIGLITADEVVAAGSGKWGTANGNYYLYKGHEYWTMTPEVVYTDLRADEYKVGSNGSLYDYYVNTKSAIAHVINIKPEYAESMIGNGTMTDPYRIKELEFSVPEAVRSIKNNQTPKTVNKGNPNFATSATTDEGVFAMEDDYGTSYYFRGAIINNYVKFAGFYWRIVRINGDGSLRLVYDGTSSHANSDPSEDRIAFKTSWNNTYNNDTKYVGYMYGGANGIESTSKEEAQTNETESNIKIELENWYKNNIYDKNFNNYVSDNIFCNDRSIPSSSGSYSLGYGSNETYYALRQRAGYATSTPIPTFKCIQVNDKFTVSNKIGNGKLKYPVGLITQDEIVTAGFGRYNSSLNTNYYLYRNDWYWSMSPYDLYLRIAYVYFPGYDGYLGNNRYNVASTGGVLPVINIKREYAEKMQGTGYMNDPYTVD